MKTLLVTSCFALGTILLPAIGHARDSDADRTHPIHFVKDSVITSKVKAKLAAEHTIPMRAIRGRASFLGERSIGHMDPGARSSALIVDAVADVMEGFA